MTLDRKALTDITQLGSATIGGEKADTETVRIDSRKRRYVGGLLSYGAERLNFDRYLCQDSIIVHDDPVGFDMQMYNIFIIFAVIMGRLLAIDYGRKRCGLAVTDVLQIVATALDTVPSAQLITYVKAYVSREPVDEIIVGLPKTPGGEPSESMRYITPAINRLRKELPGVEIRFSTNASPRPLPTAPCSMPESRKATAATKAP